MKRTDVFIIGGGPAGAVLGNLLKEKGVDYLIIERFSRNRNKICAGGLPVGIENILPASLKSFKRVEYNKITISYRNILSASSTVRKVFMYGVMRREFDEFLREGLNVNYNETFREFEMHKDGVVVKTDKDTYKTKFLVGADGVGSRVSLLSGLAPKKRFIVAEEKEIPFRRYESNREVEIFFGYNFLGYGWIFPKEKVLSAGAGSLQKYFKVGASDKFAKKAKLSVYPISIWGGEENLANDRVALIGEAGNLVDPFSAAGIFHAVFSARLLSEILLENLKLGKADLSYYNELLKKYLYSELSYSLFLSKVFYPFLPVIKKYIVKESTLNLAVDLASKGYVSYGEFYNRLKNSKHPALHVAYFIIKKFVK